MSISPSERWCIPDGTSASDLQFQHGAESASFNVFSKAGRNHVATVTAGKHPARERGAPFFADNFKLFSAKHLPDYLGAVCWTTNQRGNMRGKISSLCRAVASRLTCRTVYA